MVLGRDSKGSWCGRRISIACYIRGNVGKAAAVEIDFYLVKRVTETYQPPPLTAIGLGRCQLGQILQYCPSTVAQTE